MNKLSMFIVAGAIAAPMTACGKKAEAPPAAPAPAEVAKTEEVPAEAAGAAAKPEELAAAAEAATAAAAAEIAAAAVTAEAAAKLAAEAAAAAVVGAAVNLTTMKFGGEKFDAEYNEALSSWTIEKYVPDTTDEDGGNTKIVQIYVNMWDTENWPTDANAFAEKLKVKDFMDMGSTWSIDKTELFEGGWVLTGSSNDGEDTEVAFAVRHDKLNALCRGYVQTDVVEANRAAVLTEAIEACKTAIIP